MNISDLLIRDFVAGWFAGAPRCQRLLDLGCGTQPYAQYYADRADRIVALDHDVRQRPRSGVFVRGSADRLPFGARTFETVLCTEVLEHVPDPQTAVRECARVIVPGGVLILTVPFLHGLHEIPRDYFRFTRWGLLALFEKDFVVDRIVPRGGVLAGWLTSWNALAARVPWVLSLVVPGRWRGRLRSGTSPVSLLYLAAWRFSQRRAARALLDLLAINEVTERSTLGYMCILRRRGGAE